MSIAIKSKYLATGVLAAMLAFSPLLSGFSAQSIAFAEGDDDRQVETVEAFDNNENSDGEVATQTDGDEDSDTPVVYGGETISDWDYADNTSDNSITLTAYKGTATDIVIPGELDGKQVKISSFDMLKNKGMTSLKVEETNGKKAVPVSNSLGFAFRDNKNVKSIDLSGLNTNGVISMSSTFSGCTSLKSLVLVGMDASNVANMSELFSGCSSLTDIDLSSFNSSNGIYMNEMFSGCSSLTSLDLSNFDTSKVVSMASMFKGCSLLTDLDVSNFDTSKVTNMRYMFSGCSGLEHLDVSNFDTSNVTDMSYMFDNCRSLDVLELDSFNTSKVTNMTYMFNGCFLLSDLDVSSFDTSNVTDMSFMFCGCKSLKDLNLSTFSTSNVVTMAAMFHNCTSLTSIDLSNIDTSRTRSLQSMFQNCLGLTDLDLSSFNTSNVANFLSMFNGCSSLTELTINNFDTSKATMIGGMFLNCKSLISLDLSNFDTSTVSDMESMFKFTNLQYVDLSSFTVKDDNVKLDNMFDLATDDDGNVTELPTAIIATDSRLKALEQDGKLGNGRIPYQTSVTFNEDGVATQADGDANGTIISAGKIFYDSVDEFKEATKITPEDIAKIKEGSTKDGYTFTGWYTDATATQAFEGYEMTGQDDELTLYAGWKKNDEPNVDPTPEPGDNDNPDSGITDGDNNEQVGFDDGANADESDDSVITSAPKTGDMLNLVVFSILGIAILAVGTLVFARKRR